jgi:hypothetical protein
MTVVRRYETCFGQHESFYPCTPYLSGSSLEELGGWDTPSLASRYSTDSTDATLPDVTESLSRHRHLPSLAASMMLSFWFLSVG